MTSLPRLVQRIRAFFSAQAIDCDFEQEMESHLELMAEDYARRGLTTEEARRAARLQFGGAAQLREAHRDARGLPGLDSLLQDLRYGFRAVRKNPGFSGLAILTLGIGMGVNTAVFTIYNAAMLRPLQAVDPGRVVQIGRAAHDAYFSYGEYGHYASYSRSFSGMAALTNFVFSMSGVPASEGGGGGIAAAAGLQFPRNLGGSEPVTAAVVSGGYFPMLGVAAATGRVFLPEEDLPGGQPVAMLSDNFWQRRFLRDPATLGRTLRLNGVDVTVVGITPRGFGGTLLTVPDIWTPMAVKTRLAPDAPGLAERECCLVYGRLRPGVSPGQARDELNALRTRLPQEGRRNSQLIVGAVSRTGQPGGAAEIAAPVLLLGAVGLVLLIACANVASLLLARSAARRREIAIRLSIGASRGRVVRQLLTENGIVSLCAAASGVLFSWWALSFLMREVANSPFGDVATAALNVAPDHRILGYILLLSLISTMGFGLAPALEVSRPNLSAGLKDEGAAFGGRLRKSRMRDLVVGAQVAVCLLLLICAGMLARASARALRLDLGFDYRNVISLEVVFPPGSSAAKIAATRTQLAEELERLPEVRSVAVASRLPLVHGGMREFAVSLRGGSPDDAGTPNAWYTLVTPGYFNTLGVPLVRGRYFTSQDARDGVNYEGSAVIVSEATARLFWPGEDALGKSLAFGARKDSGRLSDGSEDAHSASSVVVGVVKDVRSWRLERVDPTDIYLPVTSAFGGTASGTNGRPMGVIAVRARSSEGNTVTAVRRLLQSGHPELQIAIGDMRTALTTQNGFVGSRLGAIGASIIGILGLLMASVGIYGTVAFAVTQRTQEIGVRMALGASRRDVLGLVLIETMRPVAVGLVVGFGLAAAVSIVMHSFLLGLNRLDPVAFLGVPAILAGVALVAGYAPARRAMRVDPMIALRYE
ncbi:MAG TPA: ABC transporter permease [Candidatus Sulfopaludibacter sp.]|jgi:predicted permease|nr:ABC transporter permease [Candidatus Sulfopaludibacter sp.]